MNTLQTAILSFSGAHGLFWSIAAQSSMRRFSQLRSVSSLVLSRAGPERKTVLQGPLNTRAGGACVSQHPFWSHQQVRTVKRGTEYQPNNIKRKRTHGWIKRISTQGGIEVILRRMLKGRKSLTH